MPGLFPERCKKQQRGLFSHSLANEVSAPPQDFVPSGMSLQFTRAKVSQLNPFWHIPTSASGRGHARRMYGVYKAGAQEKKTPPKNKEYSVLLRTLVVQEKKYGRKLGNRPTCQWFTARRTCKQFLAWRTCMSPLLDSILPTERHGICEGH